MFMRLIAIAIALMVSCSTIVEGLANCQYNGLDFSGLANNTGSYSKTSSKGVTYQWNICRISNECNALLQTTGIVSCQSSGSANGNYNTGKLENAKWSNLPAGTGKGAMLTYLSGTAPCTSSKQQRQTQMQFQCGGNNGINIVTVEETSVNCVYEIVMTTKTACASSTTSSSSTSSSSTSSSSTGGGSTSGGSTPAKKGGIGGGWVFIIILLVATVVYIGAGIGFNYKVRGLRGAEMFPNYHFWKEDFPGLLKDGVLFIKSKISGGGQSGSYQQV